MEQPKKSPTTIMLAINFLIVFVPILIIAMLWGSHINFQRQVVAEMSASSAQKIGLVHKNETPSPFGATRVWIATSKDGGFEYRSAYPIIGSVPFDFFGSGKTNQDLLAACDKLGKLACVRI